MERARRSTRQAATVRPGLVPLSQPSHPLLEYMNGAGASIYQPATINHSATDAAAEYVSNAASTHFQDLDAIAAPYYSNEQRHSSIDYLASYSLPTYATEKFPGLDVPDLTFMRGSNMIPPPSVVSSQSSTTSRRSSSRSTLSSINTELPPQSHTQPEYLSGHSPWSRGPSPLRNFVSTLPSPTEVSVEPMWSHEGLREQTPTGLEADSRLRISHPHVCLWGSNGPCVSEGFATKEELNWHVKAEHLLVCPVLGCTEGSFANRGLIEVHLKWAHNRSDVQKDVESCQSSNLLAVSVEQSPMFRTQQSSGDLINVHKNRDDSRLKMEMTIAISKKKCREQLRGVVDRRIKRNAGKHGFCLDLLTSAY